MDCTQRCALSPCICEPPRVTRPLEQRLAEAEARPSGSRHTNTHAPLPSGSPRVEGMGASVKSPLSQSKAFVPSRLASRTLRVRSSSRHRGAHHEPSRASKSCTWITNPCFHARGRPVCVCQADAQCDTSGKSARDSYRQDRSFGCEPENYRGRGEEKGRRRYTRDVTALRVAISWGVIPRIV